MKRYFHIILLLSCLFSITVYCQNRIEKDSLSKYTFSELSDKFYASKNDPLKATIYAQAYKAKALILKDTVSISDSNYLLSTVFKDSTYYTGFWREIIDKTKSLKNKKYPTKAYIILGDYHLQQGRYNLALKNYLLSKKFSLLNKNNKLYYDSLFRIGMIKMKNKEYNQAIKLYKKSYDFYDIDKANENVLDDYYSLLINLSSSYKSLTKYDSAIYYNSKLEFLALKFNDSVMYGYSLYNSGAIEVKNKNYFLAIEKLKNSIPKILQDYNYYLISFIYNLLGKAYYKLNDHVNSLKYYKKTDSLFSKTGNYYDSQKTAYKFLISFYKEKKNDKKQLEYINKLLEVDSVLNARDKSIARDLSKNYDIPNLLEEKKNIENRLKKSLSTSKKWIIFISSFATLLFLILIHQSRKRKLYKKRFLLLLEEGNSISKEQKNLVKKVDNTIPPEIIETVLNSLSQFEKKKQFISTDITLGLLASEFNTNTKYLSQIINQYKNQSFSNYINALRINYTVEKLKEDSRFRKYSIKAIANEVGFNTTESFSKAFFKNTGINPSYFIRELEKRNL